MSKMLQHEISTVGGVVKHIPSEKQPTTESLKRLDNEIASKYQNLHNACMQYTEIQMGNVFK